MAIGLRPAKGKDFLGAHVLRPTLVTADEVPDPYALLMGARVDGEVRTRGTTGDLHWRFEQMIASLLTPHASRSERLRVGEVIGRAPWVAGPAQSRGGGWTPARG